MTDEITAVHSAPVAPGYVPPTSTTTLPPIRSSGVAPTVVVSSENVLPTQASLRGPGVSVPITATTQDSDEQITRAYVTKQGSQKINTFMWKDAPNGFLKRYVSFFALKRGFTRSNNPRR